MAQIPELKGFYDTFRRRMRVVDNHCLKAAGSDTREAIDSSRWRRPGSIYGGCNVAQRRAVQGVVEGADQEDDDGCYRWLATASDHKECVQTLSSKS